MKPRALFLVLVLALALCVPSASADTGTLTPRLLTAPGALVGSGPSSFAWSPAGALLTYTEPQDGQTKLWLYDAATNTKRVLLDPSTNPDNIDVTSALWSPKGNRLLLAGTESLWLLDVQTGDLQAIVTSEAAKTGWNFLPDGSGVSYVEDNDLYLAYIPSGQVDRLTSDGSETVFNGSLDWVYNEELATRAAQPAYAWSPDGQWIVYLRLDETGVQNDPIADFRPIPPTVSYTRYPTAGTANPVASIRALAPASGRSPVDIPLPAGTEYVLPYFTWTPDGTEAIYMTLDRAHTVLELHAWSPSRGKDRLLVRETAPSGGWINEDRYAPPIFISALTKQGRGADNPFLWISERDGFMHLYLYGLGLQGRQGRQLRQLTRGDWMIDSSAWNLLTPGRPVHIDPTGGWAYFITTKEAPLERQIQRVNLVTGRLEQISEAEGFHAFTLSGDGRYLVDQFSNVTTPPVTQIVKTDGSGAVPFAACAGPSLDLPEMSREFLTLKAHDGVTLYAQLVKPENFDPARKYPVVVHWYGGPGLQMVSNRYGTTNIFNMIERDVLYTQEDFLVWRLDNRGSYGRGFAFEAPIAGELGKAALDDQIAGIEYLRTLPYVDASRIGTDGKSFGGYMTLYALIFAPDVFQCGVAGAAPTDWRYYDTIYTERYMSTPAENPDGYAATNLVDRAGQIRARPLLVHGMADTNVHLQNTVNFIQALEANDKAFSFVPLPNLGHSFKGDGLVAALIASEDYLSACLSQPSK